MAWARPEVVPKAETALGINRIWFNFPLSGKQTPHFIQRTDDLSYLLETLALLGLLSKTPWSSTRPTPFHGPHAECWLWASCVGFRNSLLTRWLWYVSYLPNSNRTLELGERIFVIAEQCSVDLSSEWGDEQTLTCEDVTLRNGPLNVFFFLFLILGVYLQIAPSSLCHKLHLGHLQDGYSKARTSAMATE